MVLQMASQGEMGRRKIFACLSTYMLLWNNLWSVSRYIMGPLSGRWRQGGIDQQCLAAPIWKYRSGFGDHRFTFFIDLLPNYTFYTSLTNIALWVVAYRDVAHLISLNLGKSWEKYAKSFDAGLSIGSCHGKGVTVVLVLQILIWLSKFCAHPCHYWTFSCTRMHHLVIYEQ